MRKKRKKMAVFLIGLLLGIAPPARASFLARRHFRESVVKVHVTIQQENYLRPWQPGTPVSGNGSGFIIRGRKILTNAHVVSDARFIEVQREGQARRYPATVAFIGHDCDLAVLTVADASFFEDAAPLELGRELPDLNDEVIALGYPMGGQRLSLTKGVVSRIDHNLYTHSQVDSHLVMQIDAAINPGNSGGPVLFKNRVVGVAFQGIPNAQNLGYAIPLPVLERFLQDLADGVYDGYPELGVSHMETTNPALRHELGLDDTADGVVVDFVDPFGNACGVLEVGDVLLAVDGRAIANDGTVRLNGQNMEYIELLERKQSGDSVRFKIQRHGKGEQVTVPLFAKPDPFVFRYQYDRQPEYFIYGGLVFAPLSRGLLNAMGRDVEKSGAHHLVYYLNFAKIDGLYAGRDQFIVLTQRLPHPVNAYSEGYLARIVSSINGVPIRGMRDLPAAFQNATDQFHVVHFLDHPDSLVLDAAAAGGAEAEILARYNIPHALHIAAEAEQP